MENNNELAVVISQAGLAIEKSEQLMKSFVLYFTDAKKIAEEAKNIVVTDETHTEAMAKAHDLRMKLSDIRTKGVEPTRIQLKAQNLRENKAIDGVANIIKALIIPVEEHLEKQEKFAEIRQLERLQKTYEDRIERLSKYVEDVSIYQLKDISDEVFEKLLFSSKDSFIAHQEAVKKAEADRLIQEAAAKKEQEQIRLDNIKLRKEAEVREASMVKKLTKQADILKKEREARKAIEAKIRTEKEKRDREERELQINEDAQRKSKEDIERAKLLAPDKVKLQELAHLLTSISMPAVSDKHYRAVVTKVENGLLSISDYIQKEIKT